MRGIVWIGPCPICLPPPIQFHVKSGVVSAMNKAELIEKIAKEAGITKMQANNVLDAFTKTVIATLKKEIE